MRNWSWCEVSAMTVAEREGERYSKHNTTQRGETDHTKTERTRRMKVQSQFGMRGGWDLGLRSSGGAGSCFVVLRGRLQMVGPLRCPHDHVCEDFCISGCVDVAGRMRACVQLRSIGSVWLGLDF